MGLVEAALAATRGRVGVIGTLATVGSDRYGELLRAQRPDLVIESKACPLFVPLAEEGWSSLHSVIDEDKFWNSIDALKNAGAEGILVVPIDKMVL